MTNKNVLKFQDKKEYIILKEENLTEKHSAVYCCTY